MWQTIESGNKQRRWNREPWERTRPLKRIIAPTMIETSKGPGPVLNWPALPACFKRCRENYGLRKCRHAPWAFCFAGIERGGIAKLPAQNFPLCATPDKGPRLRISLASHHFARIRPDTARERGKREEVHSYASILGIGHVRSARNFRARLRETRARSFEIKTMPTSRRSPVARNAGVFWVTQPSNWPIQIGHNILTWFPPVTRATDKLASTCRPTYA